MQINVTGRHVDITDAIRDHIHGKVQHAFADFPKTENVHVVLDLEKHRHFAEIQVQGAQHARIEGKAESDDMYTSIDEAIERAEKQLRRLRDKRRSRHPEGLGEMEAHGE
ncbi:ribosome hibernation-promoting factor, HPF/YfiA family [Kiritimatiella glycovorans]|uniref:Ribosome hibernation promoting factor n=1 Tax=Kiritimatiella glycovorans TaxID=1307763 RepID=A0A0G3EC33_9BACT|nr:ribosome-associated translation inhibitor RaiA [Kiritimatiella glycovorans]AKJ64056.1 Ribosome hibernation promoting factor [Kiritimatiella glycovorans]